MTSTDTNDCQGNVTSMPPTFRSVPTDSWAGRYCDVSITRCSACPGSAVVRDTYTDEVWIIALDETQTDDYEAAYWATEVSQYRQPAHRPAEPEAVEVPEDWGQEQEYIEDEDGSLAYARMLERRADPFGWGEAEDPF